MRRHIPTIILCLLALSASVFAYALDVQVAASAQPQTVMVGETLTYEVAVDIRGGRWLGTDTEPSLPDLQGFQVVGTSMRQNLQMGSGGTQVSRIYTYRLLAVTEGSYTFEPAVATVSGKIYQSGRVQVNVVGRNSSGSSASPAVTPRRSDAVPQGAAKPDAHLGGKAGSYVPKDDIDLLLSAEPEQPYVGQQVIVTFAFYQSQDLYGTTRYEAPTAENCVMKELPAPDSLRRVYEGQQYLIQQRRWAAFATTTGKATIAPVEVTGQSDPLGAPETFYSNELSLRVRPLPEPPAGAQFDGAVGDFKAALIADRSKVRAGDTLTLTVVVKGSGNLHSLGVPQPHLPDWAKIYSSREERTAAPGYGGNPDLIGGEARFAFLVLPRHEGRLEVPPLEFTYFNPATGRYKTSKTDGLTIEVEPGAVDAVVSEDETEQVRYISEGPGQISAQPVLGRWWFWVLVAVPLLETLGMAAVLYRERQLLADPRRARSLHADHVARAQVMAARDAMKCGDGEKVCSCAAHAVTDFIAHRIGLPAADVSREEAVVALRDRTVDASVIAEVDEFLKQCDYGRFGAGGVSEHGRMIEDAQRIIAKLQSLKPGGEQ